MPAFLVTWNPIEFPISDDEYGALVATTTAGRSVTDRWATGSRKRGIVPGDAIYWLRQGADRRGIVGGGRAVSAVYQDRHWRRGHRGCCNYVDIEWDVVVPLGDRLDTEVLLSDVAQVSWNNLFGSGVQVAGDGDIALRNRWEAHLHDLGRASLAATADEAVGALFEGAVTRVAVNRFERNAHARAACIAHHGAVCAVCGFDFAKVYGDIGDGVITVHHLRELSTIGEEYEVDPVKDLLPVCDNCHRMLHTTRPAMKPDALRRRLRRAGRIR